MTSERQGRVCRAVQPLVPRMVAEEFRRPRARLVARHVAGCELCQGLYDQQVAVQAGLDDLVEQSAAAADDTYAPPADLLASILTQVDDAGVRARAAAPLRGAVSGARPGMSTSLAISVLVLLGLGGWLGYRLAKALRD